MGCMAKSGETKSRRKLWIGLAASLLLLTASGLIVVVSALSCAFDNTGYASSSQFNRVNQELIAIAGALGRYRQDRGDFPGEQEGLAVLRGKYLDAVPDDAWNAPYRYRRNEDGAYRLYSVGANGRDEGGQGDDIVPGLKEYRCEDYEHLCRRPCETGLYVGLACTLASLALFAAMLLKMGIGRFRKA